MYEQRYSFELTGIRPLIMHWDNLEWADQIDAERTRIKEQAKKDFKAGDDRCPPHTWKGYTYNDGTNICIPTDCLRSGLLRAGAKVTLKNKETYKKLTQSGMLFDDLFVPLLVKGKPIAFSAVEKINGAYAEQAAAVRQLGFTLLAKRAKIGRAKHVRVRPKFDDWAATGTFLVVDDQLSFEPLKMIWSIFGLRIGLCDWRPDAPESPGPFGCFSAKISKVG